MYKQTSAASEVMKTRFIGTSTIDKIIILGVICCAGAVGLLIGLAPFDVRELYQNWTVDATSGSAVAMSALVFTKKLNGMKHSESSNEKRVSLILLLGIASWFCAEIIWSYYVYGLDVEVPYPSTADIFYLVGYPLVGYFLYAVSKNLGKENQENKFIGTAVIITTVAFVINVFLLQIVESSIGFSALSQNEIIILILSLAYPILDAILIVPSIIILYSARRSEQSLKWIMLASAMLIMAVADTGFGYTAIAQIDLLKEESTWDILYNFSYILMSGSLIQGILTLREPHNYNGTSTAAIQSTGPKRE